MTYARLLSFLLLFAFSGCEEDQIYQTCPTANPTQDLDWLRLKVAELEKSPYCQAVTSGWWKDRTVFVVQNCDPRINSIAVVYDCEGNLLCYGGDETCPGFQKEIQNEIPIWRNHR